MRGLLRHQVSPDLWVLYSKCHTFGSDLRKLPNATTGFTISPVFIRERDRLIDAKTGEVIYIEREQRARARRTLELYGFNVIDPKPFAAFSREELEPPTWVSWHYTGIEYMYGTDDAGHDYRYGFATGKTTRITSLNERAAATAYARIHGAAKASRRYGIPAATVRQWIHRAA